MEEINIQNITLSEAFKRPERDIHTIIVFYVCVHQLPPEKADRYMEKCRASFADEAWAGIAKIFIPTRTGETRVEMLKVKDA